MTEKVIDNLPEILKRHICAIRKTSLDDSKAVNMCDSELKVINFDKMPREYSMGKGWGNMPSSNDALYISEDGKWYFIEFKNGSVDKSDIFKKIYDSLVILIELGIIPDLQFIRDKVYYILVYNSDKYSKVPKPEHLSSNYSYIYRMAQQEEKLFGVEKFEGYLLKEVHTYTKELFKKEFIERMENQECMAAV